jgi:hypothetical protein
LLIVTSNERGRLMGLQRVDDCCESDGSNHGELFVTKKTGDSSARLDGVTTVGSIGR